MQLLLILYYSLSVIPEFTFRKVTLNGKWDHAHTMLVGPRVREGVHGMHVVTPLIRENGSTILVDRGFVSNERIADLAFRNEPGEVSVLGMLRTSQRCNIFTPKNEPENGKWYWCDVPAMASQAGGDAAGVQEVFVEQIFGASLSTSPLHTHGSSEGHGGEALTKLSKGVPIGRPPTVDLRNTHLSYVVTWYAPLNYTIAQRTNSEQVFLVGADKPHVLSSPQKKTTRTFP